MLRLWDRWIFYPLLWLVCMAVPMTVVWFVNDPGRAVADVNDIGISSFRASYDATVVDGRLQLAVTEVIVVEFRSWNTNHGLERRLDTSYGSTDIGITDISATADGKYADWSRTDGRGGLTLRIGDPRRYVNGTHTYTISYTISNAVVQYPDGHQEIYLDVNGTGWQQSIGTVSARISLPPSLVDRLDGTSACYIGPSGSTTRCPLERSGSVFVATQYSVTSRSTMTLAIGFLPQTATTAVPIPDTRLLTVAAIAGPLAVPVLAWIPTLLILSLRRRRLVDPKAPIHYEPPQQPPVVVADFLGVGGRGVAAELADLVVKKQAVVTTTEELIGTSPQRRRLGLLQAARLRRSLRVQLVDPSAIEDQTLRTLCEALFGRGSPRELRIDDETHADVARQARSTLGDRASLREPGGLSRAILTVGMWVLTLGGWVLVALDATSWWFLLSGTVAVLAVVAAAHRCPPGGRLTERGMRLMTHLAGLRRFVLMAEGERIAYLQNVVDAPRRRAVSAGADTLAPDTHVVSLMEPLLPYAIIFGAEDTWSTLVGAVPEERKALGLDLSPVMGALTWDTLWRVAEVEDRRWTSSASGRSEPTYWTSRPAIGQGSISTFFHDAGDSLSQAMDDWAQSRDDDRGAGGGGWFSSSGSSSSSSSYHSSSSSSHGSSGGGSSGGGMGGGGGGGW